MSSNVSIFTIQKLEKLFISVAIGNSFQQQHCTKQSQAVWTKKEIKRMDVVSTHNRQSTTELLTPKWFHFNMMNERRVAPMPPYHWDSCMYQILWTDCYTEGNHWNNQVLSFLGIVFVMILLKTHTSYSKYLLCNCNNHFFYFLSKFSYIDVMFINMIDIRITKILKTTPFFNKLKTYQFSNLRIKSRNYTVLV